MTRRTMSRIRPSRSLTRRRTLRLAFGCACLAALVAAAFAMAGTASNSPATKSHRAAAAPVKTPGVGGVGNVGTPVSVDLEDDLRGLARFNDGGGLGAATLLAVRASRAYYRIQNSAGPDCYAVGDVNFSTHRFGQILCVPDFPSAGRPILDFTVFHGPQENSTVWRSEGIAADGVANVSLVDSTGRTVGEAGVQGNIFLLPATPMRGSFKLISRDSSGAVLSDGQ